MQNLSYENKFNLHEKELVHEAHIQMNGTKTRFDTESKSNSEMPSCLGHCSIKANNEITACNYSGSPPLSPSILLVQRKVRQCRYSVRCRFSFIHGTGNCKFLVFKMIFFSLHIQ